MDFIYLSYEQVLEIHDYLLEATHGRPGILNENLIQSALGRAQWDYIPTLEEKAAALLHSLVTNHGFTDGNKRTGIASTAVFLMINGYFLSIEDEVTANYIADRVKRKAFNYETALDWIKEHIRPI